MKETGTTVSRRGAIRHAAIVSGSALAVLFSHAASAQVLRDPPTPFGPLVYDNTFNADRGSAGVSQALKNLPLGTIPGWTVDLGGSLREQLQVYDHEAFGIKTAGGVANDTLLLHRLLLSANVHLGPHVRVFVQFGDDTRKTNNFRSRTNDGHYF